MRGYGAILRLADRARGFLVLPIAPGFRTRFGDVLLITSFTALSALDITKSVVNWAIGWDALIYTDAARAMLAGGDAWGPAGGAALFAGPPPSLIPFFAFVWLPDPVIASGGALLAGLSGVYVLRKLDLPIWWFVFPPVLLAALAGSTALPVTALIVRGGPIAEGLAIALRPYAAVPIALLGRWRALVAAAVIVAVTAPFLDWPRFLSELAFVRAVLDDQTGGGKSAAAIPLLIPITVLCLFLLGRRRGAWLSVSALWPYTQTYYAVLAMPVIVEVPFVALALAIDLPGMIVAGLVAQVIAERLRVRAAAVPARAPAPVEA